MEELEKDINKMQARRTSFEIAAPEGKGTWLKRLGRKLTFWYVRPFGEAQNAFNTSATETAASLTKQVEQLNAQLATLSAQTERRMQELAQVQRQTQARAEHVAQESLAALAQQVNDSLCAVAPDCRVGIGSAPLTRLPLTGAEELFQEMHAVQTATTEAQTAAALDALEARYTQLLEDAVHAQMQSPAGRMIALVCRSFSAGDGMEAVRNEVGDLYHLLQRSSRYQVCIVSIEAETPPCAQCGNVYYVAEEELARWMAEHDPILLIFCESTPDILSAGKQCMLLRNSIVRLSAENPVQTLGGSRMQELLHLADYGVQRYCTASRTASERMEAVGFRRPAVIYPYLAPEKPLFHRAPRTYDAARLTVGFASSPMQPEQAHSRGIPALCEVVALCPDMQFVVLWRDADAVPIPDALQSAPNCEIRKGKCDMAQFYSEIDCVLIPYADENYNHACSLSALEGMLMGIPAIVTPAAGVSELVAETGLGMVAAGTSGSDLAQSLVALRGNYAAHCSTWRIDQLRQMLSGKEFVRFVEFCAEHAAPYGVITIYEWDRQLKLENRHLVKGHAALKAYYQRQEIAADYTQTRFVAYPQNCFDLMERQSVAVLLAHFLRGTSAVQLLDLACGDGRILQTLLPFGDCTAADASPAMLSLVEKRFAGASLHTRILDLLADALTGCYDVITIFRFLRHYEYGTRRMLWRKLRGALSAHGVLLFDVPNRAFEVPNRQRTGWGKYNIYDVFWTRESIAQELRDNGLALEALVPIGQGLYPLPAQYRGEPMTWTAAVRRLEDWKENMERNIKK